MQQLQSLLVFNIVSRFADLWLAGLKDIPEQPVYRLVLPLCQCYG